MDKAQARAESLKARDSLNKNYAEEASLKITERFLKEFSGFNSFLCYSAIRSEVDTKGLIDKLYFMGKAVYLPRVVADDIETGLYEGDNSLVTGAYGVREPAVSVFEDSIDIAVVPGAVFDKNCSRAGYGKGYYDRFLKKSSMGIIIGFAFECQVVDILFTEPHDVPCNLLITENNIYRRNS